MSSKLAFPQLLCSSKICRLCITPRIRANARRNTQCQPIQLSKIFASDSIGPPRSRRNVRSPFFFKRRRNNKKPGVERRANPSVTHPDGFARCSTICYPEFVIDLSSGRPIETLNAPDATCYSSDESRVYQNHSIRQAVVLHFLE